MLFIQANKICFRYEEATENLIENINFNLAAADKIGLVGKNGCGKTTLFNLILGNLKLSDGLLYISDNLKIGYLAQETQINNYFSFEDYLWSANPQLFNYKNILKKFERDEIALNETDLIEILANYDSEGGYLFETELEKIQRPLL